VYNLILADLRGCVGFEPNCVPPIVRVADIASAATVAGMWPMCGLAIPMLSLATDL
jgi:hypothetical protein